MTNREKAEAAWGRPLPDWLEKLAAACDDTSVRKAAADMDVSPAIVSLALRNKYHAPLDFIEHKVKTLLGLSVLPCPVLGMISREDCKANQRKPFSPINPIAVQLFRACRGSCVYSEKKKEKHHAA